MLFPFFLKFLKLIIIGEIHLRKNLNILLMCGKFPCYEKLKAFCQIISSFDPIIFVFSNNDQIKKIEFMKHQHEKIEQIFRFVKLYWG
jgi:hypothetical protein